MSHKNSFNNGCAKVWYYTLNYIVIGDLMLELITVKEYSNREKISETATRKRLAQSFINSTKIENITYIIYENPIEQQIKELKSKIKLKNEIISKLRNQNKFFLNQETKINELEKDLKDYVIRERGLYEKVIGQLDKMMLPNIKD